MLDQIIQFSLNNPLLVSAFILLVALVIFHETRSGAKGVTIAEAVQLLNRDEGLAIDIRDVSSFNQGHITGSFSLPMMEIDKRASELDKHKTKTLIVVCNTGTSAGMAVNKLIKLGYEKVVRLNGGITQWQTDAMPLVKAKTLSKAKSKNKKKGVTA